MWFEKLRNFFSDLVQFLKNVSQDERIPQRDKAVLAGLIVLVISPVDIIPDWIPIFGLLDDLVILAIIADYFFEILDQNIILSHYPWGMKSYTWLRRASKIITHLTPKFIKNHVWKYKPDPYQNRLEK